MYCQVDDLFDFFAKPFRLLTGILREMIVVFYLALGLMFLFFLMQKEFPEFKEFSAPILEKLNILK